MIRRHLPSLQPAPSGDVQRNSSMIGANNLTRANNHLSPRKSSHDNAALERIASEKRVSLSWVVRDAVTRYLALPENTPRFNESRR